MLIEKPIPAYFYGDHDPGLAVEGTLYYRSDTHVLSMGGPSNSLVALNGGGGGGATPAGPTGAIQYNAGGGALGGSANATVDPVTGQLAINLTLVGGTAVAFASSADVGATYVQAGYFYGSANGRTLSDGFYGIEIASFDLSGGSAVNSYGLFVDDQTAATHNWAFKSGAGMVEVGDATKAAGIHVKGVGAFDINGVQAQLWSNIGTSLGSLYNIVLSNETAGNSKFTGIYVSSDGSFNIGPNGDSGSEFGYDVPNSRWFFSGNAQTQVGAPSATAGIHVQGAGAFDVDGSGSKAQLWSDIDSQSSYSLALSNRTAGLSKTAIFGVMNTGDFYLGPNGDGGTELTYSITSNQWRFTQTGSLQVSSWISTTRNTAPADGDLAANELAYWFDPTNGAAKVMFKGKSANGTAVTGQVALA